MCVSHSPVSALWQKYVIVTLGPILYRFSMTPRKNAPRPSSRYSRLASPTIPLAANGEACMDRFTVSSGYVKSCDMRDAMKTTGK